MEDLIWFCHNLEQQVEDIEYRNEQKQIVLFFDTADIQGTIIGFPELYDDHNKFVRKRFDEKRTLVRSLIASGCFQRVQMLIPHQLEFVQVIEAKLPILEAHWQKKFKQFFLDFYSYLGVQFDSNKSLLAQLNEALFSKPDLADAWFKFLQNIEPWQRRFEALKRLDILFLDEDKRNWLNEIVGMRELEQLKKGFEQDEKRRHYHVNNLTDAIALTYLIKMVDLFNQDSSDIVPRFFDPLPTHHADDSTFRKAVKFAKLEEQLRCKLPKSSVISSPSSILRNEDYFIFKIALRNPFSAQQSEQEVDSQLIELYRKVAIRMKENQPPEAFSDITYQGEPLDKFIENLQKFAFLKNDWLQLQAQRELSEKMDVLRKKFSSNEELQDLFTSFYRFYESRENQDKVREEISKTKKDLQEQVNQKLNAVSKFKSLWNPLEHAIHNLRERIHPDNEGYYNTFRDLGLLRYGFPQELQAEIQKILDEMYSGDEDLISRRRSQIINAYLSVQESDNGNIKQMILTTAVLLALRINAELLELLSMHETKLTHFSLKAAYAEMLFRIGKEKPSPQAQQMRDEGENIIKHLIATSSSETYQEQEKINLNVAIAYLSYHAWRFHVGNALWREISPSTELGQQHVQYQFHIFNAIKYAHKAYLQLDDKENLQKKVYALNQFIFYSVEGGDLPMFNEVRRSAQLLANYKDNHLVWQFRYDDTLARYFHRLSLLTENVQKKKEYIENGMVRIKAALKMSDGDIDIEHYHAVLTTYAASID